MGGGRQLVAGVDCSTHATKVLVVDPDDGLVVAAGRAPHEVSASGGARETDPEVWWRALRDALAQCGRAGEPGAISVAGQQHGLVVTGSDARPLRPAVLWNDTRSAPDTEEPVALGAAAQAAACLTGAAPEGIARRWDTRRGETVEPPPAPASETLQRIRAARSAAAGLLDPPG